MKSDSRIVLLWAVGLLACLVFKIDSWPLSHLPMFTQYKTVSNVRTYHVRLLDSNGQVIFERPEGRLPVIRFFENYPNARLDPQQSENFAQGWLRFHQSSVPAIKEARRFQLVSVHLPPKPESVWIETSLP